jgi:hypothetical protein
VSESFAALPVPSILPMKHCEFFFQTEGFKKIEDSEQFNSMFENNEVG